MQARTHIGNEKESEQLLIKVFHFISLITQTLNRIVMVGALATEEASVLKKKVRIITTAKVFRIFFYV